MPNSHQTGRTPQPIGWCADYRGRRYRREPLDGSVLKGCTPLQHSVGTGGFEKGFAQGVTLAADPSSELVPAGGTLEGDEEGERKGAATSESRASPRSTARTRKGRR